MRKIGVLTILSSTLIVMSCSLDVTEKDSVVVKSSSGTFTGVDPAATLTSAYADIRDFGTQQDIYALLEISSDEVLCPTRGTDWGDNGVWRVTQQHTYDATALHLTNAWNNLNTHTFKLFQMLHPASNASAQQAAEAKFLRAYNSFLIFDCFRQIPVADLDHPGVSPQVLTGQNAIDYIQKDITDALATLTDNGPGAAKTKPATKAAANFLNAKLNLNKFIYLNQATPLAADMNAVIASVDAITAAGFKIESTMNYFEIFLPTDDTETIFWIDTSVGNRMWCGLHYYQVTPDNTGGGWNGFCTMADFYNKFEGPGNDNNTIGAGQEVRRGFVPTSSSTVGHSIVGGTVNNETYGLGYGFLVGQQYGQGGVALTDRGGAPLVYTSALPGISGNNEKTGARILKYHPSNGAFANHEILFRYADAVLMKAEAILRGGTATNSETPAVLVGNIRSASSRNSSSHTLSVIANPTLEDIYDERGRELYIEGWRRNDMIRFGHYTDIRPTMPNPDPNTQIFPIPLMAMSSNPNLKQNPGY